MVKVKSDIEIARGEEETDHGAQREARYTSRAFAALHHGQRGTAGYGNLPDCMAEAQYLFLTDPNLRSAPTGHAMPLRKVGLSAGGGFDVVTCGQVMTMPSLPESCQLEKSSSMEKDRSRNCSDRWTCS